MPVRSERSRDDSLVSGPANSLQDSVDPLLTVHRRAGNSSVAALVADRSRRPDAPPPAHGTAVQRRDASAAELAWAVRLNTQIERIENAVSAADTALNTDAEAAIADLRATRTAYSEFEERYDQASRRVREGIRAAQAREQQIDDGLSAAFSLVLFAAGGPWAEAATGTVAVLRAVNEVKGYVDALGSVATVGGAVAGAGRPGTAPADPLSRIPVRSENIDWAAAMDTTLDAFDLTINTQRQLNGIENRCRNHIRFLTTVRTGGYEGDSPQADRHGLSAQSMADAADEIIRRVAAIRPGVISTRVRAFRTAAEGPLQGRSRTDLEREISIRLIAGLSYDEAAERNGVIRGGKDYLREIGLIDQGDNVLGFDSGISGVWDTGAQVIRLVAQSEANAMSLVGGTGRWVRTSNSPFRTPGRVFGRFETGAGGGGPSIRAAGSQAPPAGVWWAWAPASPAPAPGDTVVIESYTSNHEERSKWTSYGRRMAQAARDELTFRVRRA